MADENNTTEASTPATDTPQFGIHRIYVKDISFEAPFGASLFSQAWKPSIQQEIATKASLFENDVHEVVLMLTITGKINDQPAFVVEVQQAGLFLLKGFEADVLRHFVGANCPAILFPYAREAVDSLMVRGGLPPLNLPPINFEQLYQHALSQQAAQVPKEQTH